jgi:sugar/nucleoside kinase (ribokinase family)
MFVGALAALVADGRDISEAIGFAQAAAALHVASGLDARTAIRKDDVAAFMKAQARR